MSEEKYERIQAPVKFYSHDRGYGFLKRPNKQDIFFTSKMLHRSGIKNVNENDILEFDWVPSTDSSKGGKAVNIKKVEK